MLAHKPKIDAAMSYSGSFEDDFDDDDTFEVNSDWNCRLTDDDRCVHAAE